MILQSLVQYYEALERRGEVAKPGWCRAKVSFALELSPEGELKRVIPLKEERLKGKKMVWEPQLLKVPEMLTRSSGVAANFLCDNSAYLLGVDNKGKPDRAKDCFYCAKEKHKSILEHVDSAAARAVCQYFEKWDPDKAAEHPALADALEEIMAGANLIFFAAGDYAQEDEAIRRAWEEFLEQRENGTRGICLVTGQSAPIARIHGNIKGVLGAQSSGAALVSFNAPAFESHGKEQSFNAPVGEYAVYAYTTALNHLVADRDHVTVIGDTTILCWSERGDVESQEMFLNTMEPTMDNAEIVHGVFDNLSKGKAVNVPEVEKNIALDQKFYILGLAPNAARLAVRFFYCDSFGNILRHIKEHYERMAIVRPATDKLEYLGAWRMLLEAANKRSKDKKPPANMAGAVYRAIITGDRYPNSLYQMVLGRIRVEQDDSESGIYKITRGRAAIIKAFLLRNERFEKEEITVALNEDSKNIPYTLGRMFAVLEEIQQKANPNINVTIKDRYFNSACATPASIFPLLLKLKNSHTKKIDNVGAVINFEKMLTDLQARIPACVEAGETAYPRRLSLEDQGMFILGYYHQTQKRYEKKEDKENE